MTRVAFLGTGTMGLAMAGNLLRAGFELSAWNRTAERARPLEEMGARIFPDPGSAVEGCELIVTMLSEADAVTETAEQALGSAADGARWLQMSTIGERGTRRCMELADQAGVGFLDAPVLGTKDPAQKGELVILGSGRDDDLDACEAAFAAVGKKTLRVGPAGAGTRLKVVINTWIVGTVGVLAETISLAERLAVEPEQFFDSIAGGPLDLPYAKLKGKAMMTGDYEQVSFRLAGPQGRRAGSCLRGRARPPGPRTRGADRADARGRAQRARRSGHGRDQARQRRVIRARHVQERQQMLIS